MQSAGMFFATFLVALAHAILLGLPTALILLRAKRTGVATAIVAGFLIGALPIGFMQALPPPQFSSANSIVLAVDGVYTAAGWLSVFVSAGMFGLCGVIGGLGAWFLWMKTTYREQRL